MGVTGLLPNLKEIQDSVSLEKYRGKTLAIDTYGWLHRGLISCAQELCEDRPTRKYVTSIMKKVDMLRFFGVEPYFVFDGAALPTKAETANDRRLKREEARKKADEFTRNGNRKLAWKEYMKAACVTSQMAKSLMVEFDAARIKYIVAPYEADPQMVYLEKIGAVDGILSEDSDLLIFGCNRLITKLKDDGSCVEICREEFHRVKSIPYLTKFTQEQLRLVAMLSGCDYTKGVPGVGLKTAFTLVKKYNNLDKILAALRADGKAVPDDFLDEVNKADLAFQFQKVFNPKLQQLTTLCDYPEDINVDFEVLESCCGRTYNNELYQQICNGHIHPNSHEILVSREQSLVAFKSSSVNLGSRTLSQMTAQRSKTTTQVFTSAPKRSVLDLLKVTKTVAPKSPSTPSSVKRPLEAVNTKLSPTSKKMKKICDQENFASPVGKVSRFFGANLQSPKAEVSIKTQPVVSWDSSMLSGDSDFTDEFGSPVAHKSKSLPPNTEAILEELTDNDDIFDDEDSQQGKETTSSSIIEEEKEMEYPKPAEREESAVISDNFDIDEIDDEIEESPVKTKQPSIAESGETPKLTVFRETLRSTYSFTDTNVKTSLSKTSEANVVSQLRAPLRTKDFNAHSQYTSKPTSNKLATSSTIISGSGAEKNMENCHTMANAPVQAQAQTKTHSKQHISLQRFAFRR
ncbi:exonuclease [Scheffersomyces xylosifermentans]|uniref:exonuclease n=1 Tax=Scheffersomyces xylosifermentans TaxID=1304137 RepID=UPI00315C648E